MGPIRLPLPSLGHTSQVQPVTGASDPPAIGAGSTGPPPQVQLTCSSGSQNLEKHLLARSLVYDKVTQDQPGEEMQRAKSGERARGFHDLWGCHSPRPPSVTNWEAL